MSNRLKMLKSAEEVQDEIFQKMSADRKLEIGAELWRLAKELVGDKISYGRKRSKTSSSENSRNS